MRIARNDDAAQLGCDIEDLSAASGAHGGQQCTDHSLRAEDIGVEDQLRGVHVLDFDRAGKGDAGIVDQDIDRPARLRQRFGNTGLNLRVRGDVNLDHGDVETIACRESRQFVRLRTRKIAHGCKHFCPKPRVMLRAETAKS